ncbi:restriction endonuclease subunit S [Candidatus Venteria ishoeyi]|uniref:Type I restriction modification DNA specificity domain protein n=1 Tax=Candidatus Venteria ishoeyi TaxID=1899563 RepID=A0A1H6F3U7_9GAMM|nr:restriction endonuclease subunit S [Candidatus Venteria ishoeyi]SEH04243.1 Type I restriction modification DNA specificity domain protein [Candidatus Venteria ishoeyi]
MNKPEKKGLVPELRFPEFLGEWDKKVLEQVAEYENGKAHEQDIDDQGRYIVVNSKFISTEGEVKKFSNIGNLLANEDDILMVLSDIPNGRAIAKCFYVDKDNTYTVNQRVCKLTTKNIVSEMLFFILDRNAYFLAFDDGVKQTNLKKGNVLNFPILLPKDVAEQQKIADCLTAIDDLITAQTQKLDTLKTHKKGLMQQLFPAEGETLPKLRFPEFRDEGEWNTKALGKLIKINSGKGFKASEYSTDGIRLLQIENVGYSSVKWTENTIYLPKSYTLEYPGLVLCEGDIVLALNRPVTNNELKIARLRQLDEPSLLYQRVGKLELLSEAIVDDFVFHMSQWFIRDFVIKQSIGSDQPFISVKTLYAQEITIPSPPEQQKIADCLASLDALITAQAEKIDTLKTHKKGLMQQLFPTPEANG